jgi:LacI family transcriptional regulator
MGRWTINDVARKAGVSKTTVSRVLNDRPDVDADTLARVRRVVDDLGYVQSARAVQLARGKSNAVGLLGPFDISPWFIEVIHGAMEQVRVTDFSLTMHAFPETAEAAERFGAQLRSGLVDALLVVSLQEPLDIVYRAHGDGLPVVCINDYGFNRAIPTIAPDDATGIGEAVKHLIDVGRSRFAILVGPTDYPVSEGRLAAYRATLRSFGFDLDDRLIILSPFTEAGARAATAELLDRGIPFDALFASSDAMAVGAIRVLKERGYRIPADVSVVGFDDFPAAELTEPRLTTVRYPLYEMTTRAVKRLLGTAQSGKPLEDGKDIVRTHLIVRGSSDPGLANQESKREEVT